METDYPPHSLGILVDTTYDVTKREVAAPRLKPGEKLDSRILVEQYQVSETPIKQALNRPITEGLTESIPRKGVRVWTISWAEIDEVLELWLTLGLFSVPDVIRNPWENPELTEQLNSTILCQTACLGLIKDADYYNRTYKLDNQFHELCTASGGNSRALEAFHNLDSHVYSNFIYRRQPKEQTLGDIREHQNILGTLVNGDEDKAKELIIIHISNARNHIYVALKHNDQL